MIFLKWAFLNLYRNKRRSLSTGLALVFGFTGMLLLSGYISAIEKSVRTQVIFLNHTGHFSILKKGAVENVYRNPEKFLLSKQDQDNILTTLKEYETHIEKIASVLSSFALISSGEKNLPVLIQAYPKGFSSYIVNHAELKKWLPSFQAKLMPSEGVSITPNIYLMLGKDKPVPDQQEVQLLGKTLDGYLNGVTEVLTGVHTTGFAFAEDISAKMSIEKLQELLVTDKIRNFAVFLKNIDETKYFVSELGNKFSKMGFEVFGYNTDEVGFYYTGSMSFMNSIGMFFYILITLASILSVVNTLTMSINERTKEIGTLRSMGFTTRKVTQLFTLEILILSVICTIISTVLYIIFATFITSLKIPFEPAGVSGAVDFTIIVNFKIAFVHALILTLLMMVTAFFSCRGKLKSNIAELINEQGVFK